MSHAAGPAVRLDVEGEMMRALINRPRTRNAIDLDVLAGLEAMLTAARNERVKALVLRGAGGSFCSGADLHLLRALLDDEAGLRSFMSRLGAVLEGLEQAPWANVAVVEGYALAGGCELLLACDIVLASADARIGDRHVEHDLVPAAGGSVRLPRAVSPAFARYLLLTGETISGAEAAQRGLASLAVAPQDLDAELERVLARLCGRGRETIATMKAMLAGERGEVAPRLREELDLFLAHVRDAPDAAAGLERFLGATATGKQNATGKDDAGG